ncbi:hypothetical protein H2201_000249 [Coniosporium apollinis]|uniref:DUF1753-domain-containing protein n=1 Tax=Coniosporium apollinis TaxID=61459 RepID=A0ABQ9PAI6_9PEZI|nr:hypothetical protein H2201_000249 [Coniosporium apollinis]
MARPAFLEIPRPKAFLYLMSLRTGTELITTTVLINKISGLYGILALLTGQHLSPLQLSMYIYSILAVLLTLYLMPHIRAQSPLQCLALAWFYAIDSAINAAYTAAFGVAWFLVLATHPDDTGKKAPGGSTIDEHSGFTSPKYNVSHVDIVAAPASGLSQDAAAVGSGPGTHAPAGLGNAVFQSGSIASIAIISALWALRLYFVLVMLAYARAVLRQHIAQNSHTYPTASDAELAENPFAEGKEEGQGWQGRLGRLMVSVGKKYWLGKDEDQTWVQAMGGRFNRKSNAPAVDPAGVFERERRRRSGTGPPPPLQIPKFGGQGVAPQ